MTAEEAQQLLEISSPFTSAELKDAHKRSLVSWFPAQFMGDRSRLLEALDHTNRLHQAYDVLLPQCSDSREWLRRENGEPDPEPEIKVAPEEPASLPAETPYAGTPEEEVMGYVGEPGLPEAWKNAPVEVPMHSTNPDPGTVPSQREPQPYRPEVPAPTIASSPMGVTVAPAPPSRATVVSRTPGQGATDTPGGGGGTEESSPAAGTSSQGKDPSWTKPTWRTEIIHATKPTSHMESAPAPKKSEEEPWTRGWLAEMDNEQEFPSHLPPIPAPVHDLLTNSAAAGPLSSKRGDAPAEPEDVPARQEAPPPAAPVSDTPGAALAEDTPAAPPKRPKVVISPRLKAAATRPEQISLSDAPSPGGASSSSGSSPITPTAPVPVYERESYTPAPPEPRPQPPVQAQRPAPSPPPPPPAPAPASPPPPAAPSSQRSGSMLMQAVINSGKTIAPARSESRQSQPQPQPQPQPPPPATSSRFSVYDEEEDDGDMSPQSDHSLVTAMGNRYHPAETESHPSAETTRHLPARPLAPHRGPKPAKERREKAREEHRSRQPMPLGTAVLRFLLVALVILGFAGGVYWVSQLEVTKDPFGMENGVGARVLQMDFTEKQKMAERGNKDAQYAVSQAYQQGRGVKKNPEQAMAWLHKAAEQGHTEAQRALGDAYKDGIGVAQDKAEALKWYNRAQEKE